MMTVSQKEFNDWKDASHLQRFDSTLILRDKLELYELQPYKYT